MIIWRVARLVSNTPSLQCPFKPLDDDPWQRAVPRTGLQEANFGLQAEGMWAGQIFLPRMLSQASFTISKEQVDEL